MDPNDSAEAISEIGERGTKRLALLIAVFAVFLSLAEMTGGNAEQDATKSNIDAANLWSFFQAKTIRQSLLQRLTEVMEIESSTMPEDARAAVEARLAEWRATIARYDSEPQTQEGRRELAERARAAEAMRDRALAVDNMFDYASAAFQLAIVLISAAVVLGVAWLAWIASAIGGAGVVFAILGWFAPTLLAI